MPASQKNSHKILCYPAIVKPTLHPGDTLPGEVVLFHFEGKSRIMCAADGTRNQASATKFAGQSEAEAYARQYVAEHPGRGCRLYDSTGASLGEIRGLQARAPGYTRRDAKRDLSIGLAAFFLIPVGFLFDKWIGWGLFLGMAIATKFVLLGIVKLSEGIAGILDTKPVKR